MRLHDLTGKEVINLADGARIGMIDECELVFDGNNGQVAALLLPNRIDFWHLFQENRTPSIPWQAIKRIGQDFILVDYEQGKEPKTFLSRYNNLSESS
jgi:YlmC/YmxH family sporulation protein